ncbi:MAG TPA: hemolysin family protein [bacterium]|nr:hemolysin family protein [bacterium]
MNWDVVLIVSLKILAVLVLVALNGFFVAAEFALVRIRDTQLDALVAKGKRGARLTQHILGNLNSYLSAAQLGITLASLGLGWIGEPVFMTLLEPVFGWLRLESIEVQHVLAFVVGLSVITFLHITVGEQAPKLFAIQKPMPTALWSAYPLLWFYRLSYPFVVILNFSSRWLLRRAGLDTEVDEQHAYSEEELRLVLASAKSSPARRDLVLNALDLRHRTAREVMRPRNEITFFDSSATISECLALAEKTRYSRFPVCADGDLDKTLGVVHIKDLYALRDKARTAVELLPLARKLFYIPETAPLDNLLRRFLDRKSHFAVVVDESGGTVGIVTLENTIEALVGQIQDEFDTEKSDLVQLGENVWEAAGTLALHDLEKIIGPVPHDENTTTVSGWLTEKLGGFPRPGDFVMIENFELRVEEMDGPRVGKLKISRKV